MGHDRDLTDTIKIYFARKSSAQLQEIVQAENQARWSLEAIAAASEVLQDRLAGRAQEPQVAEEEQLPPPYHYDPDLLALGVLGGLFTGHLVIPYESRAGAPKLPEPLGHMGLLEDAFGAEDVGAPDLPIPFGPNLAWLALDTTDTEAVATALGLRETRPATWAEGIAAAHQTSVFITPPLADWTLVVGTVLFPAECAEAFVKPLLERLSRQFGDAQYFCTHRVVELHVWARARQGRLVRGHGWLGEKSLTVWDEGVPTKEERALGFRFPDRQPPKDTIPDENSVMQLASLWSIDPTSLNDEFKEPVMGLLADVAAAEGPTSQ